MKAILVRGHGGPDVMVLDDIADPSPGPGEVVVDISAAGVNFIDTYQREGLYPMTLPYTPGLEGSGVVSAVGEGVSSFSVGDRVAWNGVLGSYAEKIALPEDKVVAVPDGVDLHDAAQLMLQGITAHYLITSLFEIKPGHTALVHAAAGGVGLLLCQMISKRGGTVIGTVSTDAKADAAKEAGAHHIIRYDREDFASRVRDITGNIGVDVVYDGVGQATFDGSLNSLKSRGMMALFGQSSGPVQAFDPQILNQRGSLFLTRPSMVHYLQTRDELAWRASEVFSDVASGALRVTLGGSYPLGDAAHAHADLQARKTSGKLLLIP